jgi:general secretion pathway protein G
MGTMTVSMTPGARRPDAAAVHPAASGMGTANPAPPHERQRLAMPDNVPAPDRGRCREDAGFTLLELLVVIVILGLPIGLVAPAALRQLGGAKVSIAHQSIERLTTVLDLYRLDVGNYPSTEQGLLALVSPPSGVSNWNGPYLKGAVVPVDPWNHPFAYHVPSTRRGFDYDLCSPGPNGQGNDTTQQGSICN